MGVADGSWGSERVALLPVKQTATAADLWAHQEYFELYPRIESLRPAGSPGPTWIVRVPDGTPSGNIWPLKMRLANSRP